VNVMGIAAQDVVRSLGGLIYQNQDLCYSRYGDEERQSIEGMGVIRFGSNTS
jgi:hypothetical protein